MHNFFFQLSVSWFWMKICMSLTLEMCFFNASNNNAWVYRHSHKFNFFYIFWEKWRNRIISHHACLFITFIIGATFIFSLFFFSNLFIIENLQKKLSFSLSFSLMHFSAQTFIVWKKFLLLDDYNRVINNKLIETKMT